MRFPFQQDNKDFEEKIQNNKEEIDNKISHINSTVKLINDGFLNQYIKPAEEGSGYITDTIVGNMRRRIGRSNDEITQYVRNFIDKKDNFSNKETEKAKKELTKEYKRFFNRLVKELETYKDNLIEKKDRLDQIKYEKERLGDEFNSNEYELPEDNNKISKTLDEIENSLEKGNNNDDNSEELMMSINEFVIYIILHLKRINDLDYNVDDYQMYQNIYPEKTEIIRRNIENDKLTYLCNDAENLPPLTMSQVEVLNMIKQMIENNENISNINQYTQEIIQ